MRKGINYYASRKYNNSISTTSDWGNSGYEIFFDPNHPLADSHGRVYYHRHLVSCFVLKRWIQDGEHTHHKNGRPWDNRLYNLTTMPKAEHLALHRKKSKYAKLVAAIEELQAHSEYIERKNS